MVPGQTGVTQLDAVFPVGEESKSKLGPAQAPLWLMAVTHAVGFAPRRFLATTKPALVCEQNN